MWSTSRRVTSLLLLAGVLAAQSPDSRAIANEARQGRPIELRRGPGLFRGNLHLSVIDILRYCRLGTVRADKDRDAIPYEN